MRRLAFVAYGQPIPQGSTRAYGSRVIASNGHVLKPWRQTLASAAIEQATQDDVGPFTGPVVIRAGFYFRRPKHHYGTGKNADKIRQLAPIFPTSRGTGDLDKLVRACGDALTDCSVLHDDAQIVKWVAAKHWCSPNGPMQTPGAVIEIAEIAA